jgi:hypothetical protein
MGEIQSFDLSEQSRLSYENFRMVSWIFVGGAVLFLFVLVVSISYNLSKGTLLENVRATYGVTYVGLPAIAALSLFGAWKAGSPGAVKVTVQDDALTFFWRSDKADPMPWDDSSFALTLIDATSSGVGKFTPLLWEARRWNRPKTELTKDAFEAIVDAAQKHRMVIERKFPTKFGWAGCEVICIKGPSRTT